MFYTKGNFKNWQRNFQETKICIPPVPRQLMQILMKAGYQAYVVGGCVRDSLLGKEPHDWDICTNALPDQMKQCFADYHVIETGLQHGTLTVMVDNIGYEITTFRTDGDYSDHRHPDSVQFVDSLHMDLQRRDFTINAMAADINGKIIDYVNGEQDLVRRIIRCVGNAKERFQEDPLRILRAMRFESVFGFVTEGSTEKAMRECRHLLSFISPERINAELSKMLMGNPYFPLLSYPDIISVFIPEVENCIDFEQNNPHHDKTVWAHTVVAVTAASKDLYVRLALLYHDIGKPLCYTVESEIGHFYGHAAISKDIAEKSLRNLRFDNDTVYNVTQLIEAHDRTIEPQKPIIRRCLNKFGLEQFLRLLDVKEADYYAQVNGENRLHKDEIIALTDKIVLAQQNHEECFTLKDLAVNGNDLIHIGFSTGKMIGDCLKLLLNSVIDGILTNEKDTLLKTANNFLKERI